MAHVSLLFVRVFSLALSLSRFLDFLLSCSLALSRFFSRSLASSLPRALSGFLPVALLSPQFVLVGTATGMKLGERAGEGCIHTYSVAGTQLTLVHKTSVEGVPRALCPFQVA